MNRFGKEWTTRPSGENPYVYDVENWDNARIGWEFLRRSRRYQASCARCAGRSKQESESLSRREAQNWGMNAMVPHHTDWEEIRRKGLPIALIENTYVEPRLLNSLSRQSERHRAFFAINLKAAASFTKILDLQLEDIAKQAKMKVWEYRRENRIRERVTKTNTHSRVTIRALRRYLRLLDLRAHHASPSNIGRLLYNFDPYRETTADLHKKLSSDKKAATSTVSNYMKFWLAKSKRPRSRRFGRQIQISQVGGHTSTP